MARIDVLLLPNHLSLKILRGAISELSDHDWNKHDVPSDGTTLALSKQKFDTGMGQSQYPLPMQTAKRWLQGCSPCPVLLIPTKRIQKEESVRLDRLTNGRGQQRPLQKEPDELEAVVKEGLLETFGPPQRGRMQVAQLFGDPQELWQRQNG